MSTPLLPTTRLVATGWLQAALPGVGAGREIPEASDGLRATGFVRVTLVDDGVDPDVPWRSSVVQAECWWPPAPRSEWNHWTRAEQLANRLLNTTYDRALMGLVIDLSLIGTYGSARVHTVTALSGPEEVEEDESDWARFDVALDFDWTAI